MKFAPGTFIQRGTGSGSAAALASPAPVAPATSAPSRKMRRLRIPLPAAGSTFGRDASLFRFILKVLPLRRHHSKQRPIYDSLALNAHRAAQSVPAHRPAVTKRRPLQRSRRQGSGVVPRRSSLRRSSCAPPRCGAAGEKLIYVGSSSHLFCTNVRPNKAGRTTVGRIVARGSPAWGRNLGQESGAGIWGRNLGQESWPAGCCKAQSVASKAYRDAEFE